MNRRFALSAGVKHRSRPNHWRACACQEHDKHLVALGSLDDTANVAAPAESVDESIGDDSCCTGAERLALRLGLKAILRRSSHTQERLA